MFFLLKTVISGLLIAGASSLARKYPGPAGILIAMPISTFLAMAWMGMQGSTKEDMAGFLLTVGWITLAGVGVFFVTPLLIRFGWGFWPAFAVGICVLAAGSWIATRLGAY